MENILSLVPVEQLIYAAIAILLPSVAGLLLYLKGEKEYFVDEIDDILADLNEAKTHIVNSLDLIEDCVEGLLEGLSPVSLGGSVLTDSEKADALQMANRALTELKNAKNKISESIRIGD